MKSQLKIYFFPHLTVSVDVTRMTKAQNWCARLYIQCKLLLEIVDPHQNKEKSDFFFDILQEFLFFIFEFLSFFISIFYSILMLILILITTIAKFYLFILRVS